MKKVKLLKYTGVFAENKDIAAKLRENILLPALRNAEEVTLDFTGVEGATQSFIHALISESLREFRQEALDHIIFKGCNENVQQVILMVTGYMEESI